MTSIYKDLEEIYRKSYNIHDPLIFLHPDEGNRDYTEDEIDKLSERDFKTRWLICCTAIGGGKGKCVALRSHWTDNHQFESHLKCVRNYFKSSFVTGNATAAKSALTELLSLFFQLESSEYYSFAITIASGLSDCGKNTMFEMNKELVMDWEEEAAARRKLTLLMDILFSKMALYRFLIHENGSNSYRLAHCRTVSSTNKWPIFNAVFCFLLQLCLTAYVVAQIIYNHFDESREPYHVWNIPLACLTFIYSSMIGRFSIMESPNAFRLFEKRGPLQMLDLFVNKYLTCILLVAGFLAIVIQDSFIEAVLNSSALLFIPEIDDHLPKLFGLDENAIIKNYLSYTCLKQFDKVFAMTDSRIKRELYLKRNEAIGVPFSDYYLTHIPEQASDPKVGIFTPYQIRPGHLRTGHQIDPSNFVTELCLIQGLEWSYTTGGKYVNCSTPRIGYLKIKLLGGNRETIVIKRRSLVNDNMHVSDVKHKLEGGVYIITSFQMSNDIIRLRVCGSPNANDFLNAMEYYSLWELSENAKTILLREARKVNGGKSKISGKLDAKKLKDLDEFDDDKYYSLHSPNSFETDPNKKSHLGQSYYSLHSNSFEHGVSKKSVGKMKVRDHFSLSNPTSAVTFAENESLLFVDNLEQVVLEKKAGDDYITAKQATVSSPGLILLRSIYTLVATLVSGLLFVFCVQLVLFLFLGVAIESGENEQSSLIEVLLELLNV